MARLLVPTRNRPIALSNVLGFLDRFYPGTEVIVADGSSDAHKPAVRQVATEDRKTVVDYRAFRSDLPFFDRILEVLNSESDTYFVMGADDDYPMMDVFQSEEGFLNTNSDFVSAMGPTVNLNFDGTKTTRARLNIARPILDENSAKRALNYSLWPYSTTYALTRRETLIERYKRSRELFLAGFYDYGVGIQDALQGKIKAVGQLGYIGTRNTNHSYLRSDSRLIFLHRSKDLGRYADNMKSDFIRYAELNEDDAARNTETVVRRFVAEYCGRKAHHMKTVSGSKMANDAVVQEQLSMFRDLFTDGTNVRKIYGERLQFIGSALRLNFTSGDNSGEKKTYETLEEQAGA